VAHPQGPPGRHRKGIALWRRIPFTTGIRNLSIASVTSSKDASASSPLFRKNACHCVCFAGLAENSGVKANGRDAGKAVFRLAKIVPAYLGTGIASATTGIWQTVAAKVRVTCATGAPGAGIVRITVIGLSLGGPTS
jgi:hypothetical protein